MKERESVCVCEKDVFTFWFFRFSPSTKCFEELPPELELSLKSFAVHTTVDLCCLYVLFYGERRLSTFSCRIFSYEVIEQCYCISS